MIRYEILVSERQKVIQNFYLNSDNDLYFPSTSTVYCELLDEVLNFTNVKTITDSVSTIYIFELDNPMYTMHFAHNIGLRNFDEAMLIVEFLKKPI